MRVLARSQAEKSGELLWKQLCIHPRNNEKMLTTKPRRYHLPCCQQGFQLQHHSICPVSAEFHLRWQQGLYNIGNQRQPLVVAFHFASLLNPAMMAQLFSSAKSV